MAEWTRRVASSVLLVFVYHHFIPSTRGEYLGVKIGDIATRLDEARGTLYALNSMTIYYQGYYQRGAPAVLFYVGREGGPGDAKNLEGEGSSGVTRTSWYTKGADGQGGPWFVQNGFAWDAINTNLPVDIIIPLPGTFTVDTLHWFSVFCYSFNINLGDLIGPERFRNALPTPVTISDTGFTGNLTSGSIVVRTDQNVDVEQVQYNHESSKTQVFLVVGTSSSLTPGDYIPLFHLTRSYSGETIEGALPNTTEHNFASSDFRYLAIYDQSAGSSLSSMVTFPDDWTTKRTRLPSVIGDQFEINCEELAGRSYTIQWKRKGNDLQITLESTSLARGTYLGFGISGSSSSSTMSGADVFIAWIDQSGNAHAEDYYVKDQRSKCQGSGAEAKGVCKDTVLGGTNDIRDVTYSIHNGITRISFRRQFNTGDSDYDRIIPNDDEQKTFIIWSRGKIENGEPSYHEKTRLEGNREFAFGREFQFNCNIAEAGSIPIWWWLLVVGLPTAAGIGIAVAIVYGRRWWKRRNQRRTENVEYEDADDPGNA